MLECVCSQCDKFFVKDGYESSITEIMSQSDPLIMCDKCLDEHAYMTVMLEFTDGKKLTFTGRGANVEGGRVTGIVFSPPKLLPKGASWDTMDSLK